MLPDYQPDTTLCERFADFRERDHWVFYAPNTSEGEEARAYGVLFDILRKQTAIMMISPADPARYEPVYYDALKYSLPTIRHSRLFTSKVPRNSRVYFIEEPEPVADFYACADVVLLGGTLTDEATSIPDLTTPILAGKPVIAGPGQSRPEVAAAVAAGAILSAGAVEDMAEAIRTLKADAEAAKALTERAREWLQIREGDAS
ncbi:glycosyltransferase [Acidihalobacter prosperus]|uniref:Glycosyl transferase family 1 domain-containing protein n=1 Tax=Acidihalobacter prosperus TaxID=160660 RepID=A0A1A6C5P9_9GAMM|nr:glycosyltransferase [Acidihalobacter prosperus]OBS09888.1 hypothetical protein Thpro_020938 [Acidihalobacter prosperus]